MMANLVDRRSPTQMLQDFLFYIKATIFYNHKTTKGVWGTVQIFSTWRSFANMYICMHVDNRLFKASTLYTLGNKLE
jgi:hypothetical protein